VGRTETIVGQLSPVQSFAGNAGRESPDFFYPEKCSLSVTKLDDLLLCISALSYKS
jgi:hypothetical protein